MYIQLYTRFDSPMTYFLWRQQMRDAAERKKELEKQHQEAQQQLRQKQEEIATLTKVSESDKQASLDTIQTLESKVSSIGSPFTR